MREHFEDVVQELKREPSKSLSSGSSADKSKLKGFADTIIRNIESEERGHKTQEDSWKNIFETCKKVPAIQ